MKTWIALLAIAGALVTAQVVAAQPLHELSGEEARLRGDIDGAANGGRISPSVADDARRILDRIVADDRAMRAQQGGRLNPDQVNSIADRLRTLSKRLHNTAQ